MDQDEWGCDALGKRSRPDPQSRATLRSTAHLSVLRQQPRTVKTRHAPYNAANASPTPIPARSGLATNTWQEQSRTETCAPSEKEPGGPRVQSRRDAGRSRTGVTQGGWGTGTGTGPGANGLQPGGENGQCPRHELRAAARAGAAALRKTRVFRNARVCVRVSVRARASACKTDPTLHVDAEKPRNTRTCQGSEPNGSLRGTASLSVRISSGLLRLTRVALTIRRQLASI